MAVSRISKILFISAGILGVLAWLVIVELGINAGKVHYGVELRGDLEVGGMSRPQVRPLLKERAEEMFNEPVVLGAENIGPISVYPRPPSFETDKDDVRAVDWNPRYGLTIDALMAVGRRNGPVEAISDRFNAYFGGVKVPWQGAPSAFKVTARVIDPIEKLAEKEGLTVDRDELRVKLRQALNEWPRQPFYRIPFE